MNRNSKAKQNGRSIIPLLFMPSNHSLVLSATHPFKPSIPKNFNPSR